MHQYSDASFYNNYNIYVYNIMQYIVSTDYALPCMLVAWFILELVGSYSCLAADYSVFLFSNPNAHYSAKMLITAFTFVIRVTSVTFITLVTCVTFV